MDETTLYNAFINFGNFVQPVKLQRDDAGNSKGFGFVFYDSFEAADQAIENMNGQFLMNKAIKVQYAFKKDNPTERHGTEAERLLAAQARKHGAITLASAPPPPSFLTGELLFSKCYRRVLTVSLQARMLPPGSPCPATLLPTCLYSLSNTDTLQAISSTRLLRCQATLRVACRLHRQALGNLVCPHHHLALHEEFKRVSMLVLYT